MWKKPEHRRTVDCRHVEAALTAYLKDGLSPTRRQVVEDHLAGCDACARSVQQAQILESELRLQAARHNPTLSPEASVRIREQVYRRMRRGLMMQRIIKVAGVAVAVVAIALLAVGALALWQGRPPESVDEGDVTPIFTESAPTSVPPTSMPQPKATDTATPAPARSLYQTYELGEEVYTVTAADLDGDGYPDLAVPDAGSGVLRLLFNQGDGTFQDSVDYTTGDVPLRVVAADLDGDSHRDLVVAHMPADEISKVSVLLNNGDGTFQEAVDYALGYDSWWVRVADLDGDLDLDLATGFSEEPPPNDEARVGVWLNDGHGAFREGPHYDVGTSSWRGEAEFGDLNGDSIPDMVLSYYPLAQVTVHLGNGDATFGAPAEYEGAFAPTEVVFADLNGDAHTDLAIPSERGTLSLLLSNGDGTFQESVSYEFGSSAGWPSAVADVDANADPDLLVPDPGAGTVQVLLNDGDGTLQLAEGYQTDFSPGGVLVTDLNGDSQPELLVASQFGSPVDGQTVLSVQPLPLLTSVPATPEPATSVPPTSEPESSGPDAPYQTYTIGEDLGYGILAVADLNGDAHPDIAVTDNGGGVLRLLFNQGDGTFEEVPEIATGDSPYGVTAADLDGEGHADLVVSHGPLGDQAGQLSVMLNNGDGTFQEQVNYATVDNWISSAVDVDGDTDLDLVIEDATETGPLGKYGAVVWLNTGNGTFEEGERYFLDVQYIGHVATGDLNGDTYTDLVVRHHPEPKVSIQLGNGDGSFGEPVEYEIAPNLQWVTVADLDGDSYPDLATGNPMGVVNVLLNNGDGTFQDKVDYDVGGDIMNIEAVDMNGDGSLDLLFGSSGGGNLGLLTNNGDGTFELTQEYYWKGVWLNGFKVSDVDSDGNLDIVGASSDSVYVIPLGDTD